MLTKGCETMPISLILHRGARLLHGVRKDIHHSPKRSGSDGADAPK